MLEGAGEGRTGDWSEVVTRYPYGNVGMDHLLSMEKVTFPKLVNVIVQINKLRSSKKYLKKWCEEIEVVRNKV